MQIESKVGVDLAQEIAAVEGGERLASTKSNDTDALCLPSRRPHGGTRYVMAVFRRERFILTAWIGDLAFDLGLDALAGGMTSPAVMECANILSEWRRELKQ